MTYCLALRLDDGLVFLADTRTNAGLDNIGTYRKLHVLQPSPDRIFVLESAGNLATTQEVLDCINRDLDSGGAAENLATVARMFEAALYVGRVSRQVVSAHSDAFGPGVDATASFILGGQIGAAPAGHLADLSRGQLRTRLGRAAISSDWLAQIWQVHARPRSTLARRH